MIATLYYAPYVVAGWSASSERAGYPAGNAGTPSVSRPWAADTTVGQQRLIADLGAALPLAAICVQSITGSPIVVSHGLVTPPTLSLGDFSPIADAHGIHRVTVPVVETARYVSVEPEVGSTPVGATQPGVFAVVPDTYEIGSLYVFSSSIVLPVSPMLESRIVYTYPQTDVLLPNGAQQIVRRGAPYATITMRFRAGATDDIEQVARIARSGTAWLDIRGTSRPALSWPVRVVDNTHDRQLAGRRDQVSLTFREIS